MEDANIDLEQMTTVDTGDASPYSKIDLPSSQNHYKLEDSIYHDSPKINEDLPTNREYNAFDFS
jgi:hypothetical protein